MTDGPTVYVLDDDDGVRRSTALVLQAAGLKYAAFASAAAFLEQFRPDAPGCLILDLQMPDMNGLEVLHRLRAGGVTLPVVVVTGTGTVPVAVETMKLGIEEFLEKPVQPQTLLAHVRAALAADARRRTEGAAADAVRRRVASLTAREREVLRHVVDGLPNKLIARAMSISIKTVENHRANLMTKMGAANAAELVRISMMAGPIAVT